jgi:hypothetical protein
MKTTSVLSCALLLLLAAPAARAQGTSAPIVVDSGRFNILLRGTAVGTEEFEYDRLGDSLMVSATHTRSARTSSGAEEKWVKTFGLVVGAEDFALRSYTSNLTFGGHVSVRGIELGDTVLTIFSEIDGGGDATSIERPPGRLFVMDPMLFTLFDVICRNVSMLDLPRRPIELVTLSDPPAASEAIATAAGADTLRRGGKRVIARRWVLKDEHSTFVLSASPTGQMLRLVHEQSGLEVVREEPKTVVPAGKPKPKPR